MSLVMVPKILRDKLGEDGTEALIHLLNASNEMAKNAAMESSENSFVKKLSEVKVDIASVKAELSKEIASTRADVIKWMFLFWAGQVAVMVGVMSLFYNLMIHAVTK